MKKIKGCIFPLSLILMIPLINIIYMYLNNSSRGIHSLVTDIDKGIPFIKVFAIPYLIWSPFLFTTLIYLCFRYREVYYKVIISLIVGLILCFIIYYFFQTTVPRPQLNGNDFLTNLVKYIYFTDNPFNCFPSIHVLTSYMLIKGIKSCNNKISIDRIIITATSILIILSTQFIKQHVILDLIFAILIGNIIFKIVDSLSSEKNLKWVNERFRWFVLKNKLEA
jgi:uncharacterized membrane protein YraQ (UPF0718 family)